MTGLNHRAIERIKNSRIYKTFAKSNDKEGKGIVSTIPYSRFVVDFYKGRGIERIGAKDFELYKQMYLTDPVVQTNINIVCKYIFKDGWDIIGSASEDDKEIVRNFFDNINFSLIGFLWMKDAKVFGTGYLEFPEDKDKLILRGAKNMYVDTDQHGQVLRYIQKPTDDPKTWIYFEPEEIVCLKNNPFSDSVYGISDIESIKYIVNYMKDQAERDIVAMLNKYVGDRFIVRAGTPEHPYGKKKLDEIKDFFTELKPAEDIISAGDIDVKSVGLEGHGLDFRRYLDYILMVLAIGLGVPIVFWIPEGTTEAASRVSLRVFESNIGFYQKTIEDLVNREIMPQLLSGKLEELPKFKFKSLNLDDMLQTARTDLIYTSQGVRTSGEIREERGFTEVLDGEPLPEMPPEEEPDGEGIDGNIIGDKRGPEVGINQKLMDKEIGETI